MKYTLDYAGEEYLDGEYISPYERDDEFALGGLDWRVQRDEQVEYHASAWESHADYEGDEISARARGYCEAKAHGNASYKIGRNRRKPRRRACERGWKAHRAYQEHGRAAIALKVDVSC